MAYLPLELVIAILENVYYARPGVKDADYRTLASCALVCSSWRAPAQELLFHTVIIASYDPSGGEHTLAFLRALENSLQRDRPLGTYIRELEIPAIGKMRGLQLPWSLPRILSVCPRLYALTIRTCGLHELGVESMESLRSISSGPSGLQLRALNLLQCDVQSPLLYQLLSIWPSVKFLRIGSETAARLRGGNAVKAELYELVLHRTPQPAVLETLLAASTHSLRILEFRDLPGMRIRPILKVHAARLRSLRFNLFDMNAAAILRMFPQLEEFMLYHVPSLVPIPALPTALQHFAFRNPPHNYNRSLQCIIQAIRPLRNLRVVSTDQDVVNHSDYPSLSELCKAKGVTLRLDPSPFWTYEDPVPVAQFPRCRSLKNFVIMNNPDASSYC